MRDATLRALPRFWRGRFPPSRWRRPSIRSLRRSSAIASPMSPSPHRLDGMRHRKKVAKSHKPMRTLTKPPAASGTMLLVNLRMTAFGVRGRRAVLQLAARDDPRCVVRQRPPQGRTCTAPSVLGSSSHSRSHRVSSFRGLPQTAAAPNAELSRLRLAKPAPSKSGSLARTCGDGKAPA